MTRAQANHLLDFVRAGGDVSESQIVYALWVTGEFELFGSQAQREAPETNHESLDQ